ncbi:UNVERIFIED_CONTAM: hypothetical protein NCL1_45786 [Trichonephila clavipes]
MDRERIIFTSHHIIQIIFKHLDARSLNSCAQVCTLWNRIAVAEKSRRIIFYTFFKVYIKSMKFRMQQQEGMTKRGKNW